MFRRGVISSMEDILMDIGIAYEDIEKDDEDFMVWQLHDLIIKERILPSSRYKILEQYYMWGHSAAQIAEESGTSENHILRELSKIRHTLKKHMSTICVGRPERFRYEPPKVPVKPEDQKIEDLLLSRNARICLKCAGIDTLGDIVRCGVEGLMRLEGIDENAMLYIMHVMNENQIVMCPDGIENITHKKRRTYQKADAAWRYGYMILEELELSVRAYNCLKRAGCHTVYDIVRLGKDNLAKVRNLGRKSYEEVLSVLAQYHIYLA